ncbi:MAG: DUF1566 domain-containing protein [Pseudomonadota bacterium]
MTPRRSLLAATAALLLAIALACGKGSDTGPEPIPEGAWRDATCGLVWQGGVDAMALGVDAEATCAALVLGESPWHLPTIDELRCLVEGCEGTAPEGDCEVTAECAELGCMTTACSGCEIDAGASGGCYWPSELGGACGDPLWSATLEGTDRGWVVDFRDASVSHDDLLQRHGVLCVQGG